MGVRIETNGELSAAEAAAVRAAVERYAETAEGGGRGGAAGRWTDTARRESIRGRPPRAGGRDAWQAARDRRRGNGEHSR
jgi:hypothetical protein